MNCKPIASAALLWLMLVVVATTAQAQYHFGKVDAWLQSNVQQMGGRAVLLVMKDGKIVYTGTANNRNARQQMAANRMARRQHSEAATANFTPATQQLIASSSKWLSAALVMTFVEEGKLRLTDTVGTFLPVLSQHGKGNITIAQCMSHLTGIKAPPIKQSIADMQQVSSMDEAIAQIAAMPMEGKPGTTFHYSNVGLQIAGAVLEKMSGKSFEQLFQERIAMPLDMQHTSFGSRVAIPAGGARSTAADYLHFLQMLLQNGGYNGRRILTAQSIAAMQTNYLPANAVIAYSPAEAGNWGYGFGEWIMDSAAYLQQSKIVSSPGLFGSFPWIDNHKHYCAFLMTFYLKNEGRRTRYLQLKSLVDEAVQ